MRQQVHSRIEHLFGAEFTPEDLEPRVGRSGGEAAWRNNVDSLYDRLKHQGAMEPSRRGDSWRLSPQSFDEAEQYRAEMISDGETDLLSNFKPKSSAEYLAHVQSRTLRKRRDHEATLNAFGRAISGFGWKPATNVHPRDMELTRAGVTCLVEVKQVYRGNATRAVREAAAQLLEYNYHWYQAARPGPHLLAVFSESIGWVHPLYLDSLGIGSTWTIRDNLWEGSELASSLDLVPRTVDVAE